jgi:hypothetical protein
MSATSLGRVDVGRPRQKAKGPARPVAQQDRLSNPLLVSRRSPFELPWLPTPLPPHGRHKRSVPHWRYFVETKR